MIYCLFSRGRSASRAHFHLLNTYHYRNISSSFLSFFPLVFYGNPILGTYTTCSSAMWTSADRYSSPHLQNPKPSISSSLTLLMHTLLENRALLMEHPVRQTKHNMQMIAYTDSTVYVNYFKRFCRFFFFTKRKIKIKNPQQQNCKEPMQAQENTLCIHEFGFNSPCRYNNEVPSPLCRMDRNDYDEAQVLLCFFAPPCLQNPPPFLTLFFASCYITGAVNTSIKLYVAKM